MAYDSDRHVMVLFGGSTRTEGPFVTNETWELVAVDRPFIMEQPVSQFAQPGQGSTVAFSVKAMGPPEATLLGAVLKDGTPVDPVRGTFTATQGANSQTSFT